jgi:hypothetical protein
MQKQIKITISPLGTPTVEALNFNGVGCEAATKPIEEALAGKSGVAHREMKPEYYNAAEAEVKQTW